MYYFLFIVEWYPRCEGRVVTLGIPKTIDSSLPLGSTYFPETGHYRPIYS
jgi:hypothetical protein